MIHLPGVLAAANEVQRVCQEQRWRFCFERVLIRQHGKLDLTLIRAELIPLLEHKGELEASAKLERMLATVERRLRAKP
jgi:hypothetical protein